MTVIQTTAGLVTFDDMERPSSDSMGAPTFPLAASLWTELETAPNFLGIRTHVGPPAQTARNINAASGSNEAYMRPGDPGAGIDLIAQINIDHDSGTQGGIRISIGDPAPTQASIAGIACFFTPPANLVVLNNAGGTECASLIPFPNNDVIRLVCRDQGGGNIIAAIYHGTPNVPFLVGLNTPLNLQCTTASFPLAGAVLTTGFQGVVHQRDGDSKMFIRCGRNVVMTSLPAGFGIRLDGGPISTEVAGTATIDVDGRVLPYIQIQVVDGASMQVDSFTPTTGIASGAPSGGWGGDVFDLSSVPPPPVSGTQTPGPGQLPWHFRAFQPYARSGRRNWYEVKSVP